LYIAAADIKSAVSIVDCDVVEVTRYKIFHRVIKSPEARRPPVRPAI